MLMAAGISLEHDDYNFFHGELGTGGGNCN
jgi:hypothetical protein